MDDVLTNSIKGRGNFAFADGFSYDFFVKVLKFLKFLSIASTSFVSNLLPENSGIRD